jgi:hypothetical protein
MFDLRERALTAVGRALASVGHELNNVVGVLQSYTAFIRVRTCTNYWQKT